MAGAGIRLDYDDRDAGQALRRLVTALADPTPVFDEIGGKLTTSTSFRFEHGRGPSGAHWKPSLRAKRKGGKTLVHRGRLRHSITHNASRDGVEVGTNVKYAPIHQFGGKVTQQARRQTLIFNAKGSRFTSRRTARRRKGTVKVAFAEIGPREIDMPARPFLGLDAGDLKMIETVVARRLAEAVS